MGGFPVNPYLKLGLWLAAALVCFGLAWIARWRAYHTQATAWDALWLSTCVLTTFAGILTLIVSIGLTAGILFYGPR